MNSMKRQREEFMQVLDQCLDQVLQKGATVESCLLRYPQHVAELEPLLRTALATREVLNVTPAAKARARQMLQAAMSRPRTHSPWRSLRSLLGVVPAQLAGPYRWAAATAAVALFVILGGTGVVAAASGSAPGETLYPVKRAVEQVRLNTTFDNQAKAQLYAALASRRSQEMAVVAARGDTKNAQRLATEMAQHLQKVQDNALPGLPITVINLTPGPEANAPPEELVQEMKRLKLDVADKRNLRALQQRLENELQLQDKVFQRQMKNVPEAARKGLEEAQQATRQKYQAMLAAIKWLAQEDTDSGGTR